MEHNINQEKHGLLSNDEVTHSPHRRTWSFHKALETKFAGEPQKDRPRNRSQKGGRVGELKNDETPHLSVKEAKKLARSSDNITTTIDSSRIPEGTGILDTMCQMENDLPDEPSADYLEMRRRSRTLPHSILAKKRPEKPKIVVEENAGDAELLANSDAMKHASSMESGVESSTNLSQFPPPDDKRSRVLILGSEKCGKSVVSSWLQSLVKKGKAVSMSSTIVDIDFAEASASMYETWLNYPVNVAVILFKQSDVQSYKAAEKCLRAFSEQSAIKFAVLAGTMFDLKVNEDVVERAKRLSKEFEIPFVDLSFESREKFLALWMTISSYLNASTSTLPKRTMSYRQKQKTKKIT